VSPTHSPLVSPVFSHVSRKKTSVCSHNTTEPCDNGNVEFRAVSPVKKLSKLRQWELKEGKILYYHKEDLTQFSKNLGLNLIKRSNLASDDYTDNSFGARTTWKWFKRKKRFYSKWTWALI